MAPFVKRVGVCLCVVNYLNQSSPIPQAHPRNPKCHEHIAALSRDSQSEQSWHVRIQYIEWHQKNNLLVEKNCEEAPDIKYGQNQSPTMPADYSVGATVRLV